MSVLWTCCNESMASGMCRTKFYARAFLRTPYRAHQRYFQLCELAKRVAHRRLHRQCRCVVAKDPHSSQRFPNASLHNATSLSLNSTIYINNNIIRTYVRIQCLVESRVQKNCNQVFKNSKHELILSQPQRSQLHSHYLVYILENTTFRMVESAIGARRIRSILKKKWHVLARW